MIYFTSKCIFSIKYYIDYYIQLLSNLLFIYSKTSYIREHHGNLSSHLAQQDDTERSGTTSNQDKNIKCYHLLFKGAINLSINSKDVTTICQGAQNNNIIATMKAIEKAKDQNKQMTSQTSMAWTLRLT